MSICLGPLTICSYLHPSCLSVVSDTDSNHFAMIERPLPTAVAEPFVAKIAKSEK